MGYIYLSVGTSREVCFLLVHFRIINFNNWTGSKIWPSLSLWRQQIEIPFDGSVPLAAKLPFYTAQKMRFSIKDFFSKCDQIRSFLRIWSHLLKKSLMENFIFCEVLVKKLKLKSDSQLVYPSQWNPFKNDEKRFLLYLKSSFCSQYIYFFVLTFWSCKKTGFSRKIRLISKFMTS